MKNALIDRSKTALVVIDLQRGIVGRQTAPYASDIVVKNAAALADAFRKMDIPGISWLPKRTHLAENK
jgi:nicotinamidase-related amidase